MRELTKTYEHGTYERYVGNDMVPACDCKPCVGAFRVRVSFQNSLSRFNPPATKKPVPIGSKADGREHGIWATYNAGCRCRECTTAASSYVRKRRQDLPAHKREALNAKRRKK